MDSNILEEIFSANDGRLYFKNKLPERDKLISIIYFLTPTTGILRNMFCNDIFKSEEIHTIEANVNVANQKYDEYSKNTEKMGEVLS